MTLGRAAVTPHVAVVHKTGTTERLHRLLFDDSGLTGSDVRIGKPLLRELEALNPAALIVDHTNADFDVVRVCRDVREVLSTRLMVISNDAYDVDRHVAMLAAGADDAIPVETPPPIVKARVQSMVRVYLARVTIARILMGDVEIDIEAHVLRLGGRETPCPPLQFKLLASLAQRPNVLLTISELATILWSGREAPDPTRLRSVVSSARRTLGSGERRPVIETVAWLGYRLHVRPDLAQRTWMSTAAGRLVRPNS